MEVWPDGVPNILNRSGLSIEPIDDVIRTNFKSGPPQTRRRGTKDRELISGALDLKTEEWELFETWRKSTLRGGSLSFGFPHPVTGDTVEVKFKGQPKSNPFGFENWKVRLVLETQ